MATFTTRAAVNSAKTALLSQVSSTTTETARRCLRLLARLVAAHALHLTHGQVQSKGLGNFFSRLVGEHELQSTLEGQRRFGEESTLQAFIGDSPYQFVAEHFLHCITVVAVFR